MGEKTSAQLCRASMALYLVWLLLPAVQTTGRAVSGCACVGLFALGVAADWTYLKKHFLDLLLRAFCAAALPLVFRLFMGRGGANGAGFYVQQVMFWFPLVFAGYARQRGDRRLWRHLKWVLLGAVTLTTITTIGWLFEGMFLRGERVYAYSRSLGFGGEGREAYLKELMLRNIGGYDFVYATVVMLPFTCMGVARHTGRKRIAYLALLTAQALMIVMSQYTYAMLYAAALLAVELMALILRKCSRIKLGASLLWGCVPLVVLALLLQPLAALAMNLCTGLGLTNFARSFELLLTALQGGELAADSRLGYYLTALEGFLRSPVIGSLSGGDAMLSLHSEVLDLLSGTGLIGTAVFGCMVWLMGRGALAGLRSHPERARLAMMAAALFVTALLGTVFYSRDVMAVAALGTLLVLEGEKA